MIHLDVATVAALLGVEERTVRKNAANGRYGNVRYEDGRGGAAGRVLRIPLSGLPESAQVQYLRGLARTQHTILPDGWDEIPKYRREAAEQRLEMLQAWHSFRQANQGQEGVHQLADRFVRLFSDDYPLAKIRSRSALYRWEKKFREQGPLGLVDWRGGADAGEIKIPEPIERYFLGAYLSPKRFTVKECYQYAAMKAQEMGLSIPSYNTFKRRVQRLRQDVVVLAREGEKAFYQKCAVHITRDRKATPAGAVWEADHFQLNFFVRFPSGRIGRPFVTVFMDYRTGMYLGWCLGEAPSQYTVLSAFEMAAENPDIGAPDECIMDNGLEFTTHYIAGRGHRGQRRKNKLEMDTAHIITLFARLDVVPVFSLPGNPTGKGRIERSFLIAERFSKYWPTYVGNSPENRPEGVDAILKDPDKVPEWVEVVEQFGVFVREVVNRMPSEAPHMKGMTPQEAWEKLKHERPVKRVPVEAMRLLCMPATKPLAVLKGGVTLSALGGVRYWSEELAAYIGRKVQVRYRQHDPSVVFCFDPRTDEYLCDAYAQRPIPHGASAEDLRRAARLRAKHRKQARQWLAENAAIVTGEEMFAAQRAALASREVESTQRRTISPVPISPELREAARQILSAAKESAASAGDIQVEIERKLQELVLSAARELTAASEPERPALQLVHSAVER